MAENPRFTKTKSDKKKYTYRDYQESLQMAGEQLPPLITLVGDESYLRTAAMQILRTAFERRYPNLAISVFYGVTENALTNAVNELTGGDLFCGEKLVLIRLAQNAFFPKKIDNESLQLFGDFWKQPVNGVFCIVEVEQINEARAIGKILRGGTLIPCPAFSEGSPDFADFLMEQAKNYGKHFTADALDLLLAARLNDLNSLAAITEKCALYLGDTEKEISLATTRLFLPNSHDFNRYGLINALERRDHAAAFDYARLLSEGVRDEKGKWKAGDDNAHQALGMIAPRFEQLLRARLALDRRENVAQKLGLPPWLADRLAAAARNFSLAELADILEVIAEQIHTSHRTGGDPELSVIQVVAAVCKRATKTARADAIH